MHTFIYSNNRVAKIATANGDILWQQNISKLQKYAHGAVTDFRAGDTFLYIGGHGTLICLNQKDGQTVWVNNLKGWGYYFVTLANNISNFLYIFSYNKLAKINKANGQIIWQIKVAKNNWAHGAVADLKLQNNQLLLGITGYVYSYAEATGALLWQNQLKGWGHYFVSIVNTGNAQEAAQQQINARAAAALAV
jgi:outer membrane protein assembly factor BamB